MAWFLYTFIYVGAICSISLKTSSTSASVDSFCVRTGGIVMAIVEIGIRTFVDILMKSMKLDLAF